MGVSEHLEPKKPTKIKCQGWQRSRTQSTASCVKLSENPAAYEVKAYQATVFPFISSHFCAFQGSRGPREDTSNVSKKQRQQGAM